jgi:hypothetical protein
VSGRQYDATAMFKALVLQTLYTLSDEVDEQTELSHRNNTQ